MSAKRRFCAALLMAGALLAGCPELGVTIPATPRIATEWNELTLAAIRSDNGGPPVNARTLWHVSAATYEAWAAYDATATGYFTGDRLKQPAGARTLAHRAESISHAVYRVLRHRYAHFAREPFGAPRRAAYDAFVQKMRLHGYLDSFGRVIPSDAQRLGTQIGDLVLAYAANDGANEAGRYADTSGYMPVNPFLVVLDAGTAEILDPNRWQPLITPGGSFQFFLSPHWGQLRSFALPPYAAAAPYFNVGDPPYLVPVAEGSIREPRPPHRYGQSDLGNGSYPDGKAEAGYIEQMMQVLRLSNRLDAASGAGSALVNRSPGAFGANTLGTDDGMGHAVNPATGAPYDAHLVREADWLRVITEYWADGPASETPPGHWNRIANELLRGFGVASAPPANRAPVYDLDYDVKLYFALNAALHDAAIAAWDYKVFYDYVRPISGIRYLAEQGLLPLEAGLVEAIAAADPLAGANGEHAGEIKIRAWLGPNAGVGWMRGTEWTPYQDVFFATPPFPGYISGHSTFSRAAAEVLARMTGDAYFPGGLARHTVTALNYEDSLSAPVELQWATYYDASDESGLSRIAGGIHIAADDFVGRIVGAQAGMNAYAHAQEYFLGTGQPGAP